MVSLTTKVKQRARALGADLVGIAPVERFDGAPDSGKPQYYMPDAKSVIVIATRILKGICDVFGSFETEGKTISPHFWHGYSQLNWANSWIAIQVGMLLEDNGYKALPFPPTGIHYRHIDENEDLPDFYNKHAAVAAGLGEFGLNRLLLTPQFGAHQRLIPVVTSAPLDPDPMYQGPRLCRPEECKSFCVRTCPTKAFQDNKLVSVNIGGRIFEYPSLHSHRCRFQSLGGKYMRGKSMFPELPPDEELPEIMKNLVQKMNPHDRTFHMFTFGPACGDCYVKCPAPWK